jgi:hypothetical protein
VFRGNQSHYHLALGPLGGSFWLILSENPRVGVLETFVLILLATAPQSQEHLNSAGDVPHLSFCSYISTALPSFC